ncbi:MAG TPA: glycosyltransferase family 9 protein, partial [Flavobacterium sp.]|nr:glycosyltransferase family 9 protein [Flavobacterium sp.]
LALTSQHPEVKITMISRPLFKPFFDDIPNVSFVEFKSQDQHKGILGLMKLAAELRKMDIDAFADLHNVIRSKAIRTILKLTGVNIAVFDKARKEKKALTRAKNKIFQQLPSVFDRHVKVFADLGLRINLDSPAFLPKKNLDEQVSLLLANKSKPIIGIAPFAQHDSKVYPLDLMQQVIDNLAVDNNLFLFGSKSEAMILSQLASAANIEVVAGKLTFDQELQLISNLDLMLSMDSANGHIAAMYGVKVVTLYGATHPYTGFLPYNQPFENALVSDRHKFPQLPTSIYGNKKVIGYENAMRTISPEMVVAKVSEVLS